MYVSVPVHKIGKISGNITRQRLLLGGNHIVFSLRSSCLDYYEQHQHACVRTSNHHSLRVSSIPTPFLSPQLSTLNLHSSPKCDQHHLGTVIGTRATSVGARGGIILVVAFIALPGAPVAQYNAHLNRAGLHHDCATLRPGECSRKRPRVHASDGGHESHKSGDGECLHGFFGLGNWSDCVLHP